jgi:predicted DNA-binding transcriptional regulator YafY
LEYAHDITVIDPPQLREKMVELLGEVRSHHG